MPPLESVMSATLPVCAAARLPVWRLGLGFLVPAAILVWLLLPAPDLRLVEAIDWPARHAKALAEAGSGQHRADSLLPTARKVPESLADFVAAKVGANALRPEGLAWAELHAQLRVVEGRASPSAWRRGSGARAGRFWFRPDEAPFAGLPLPAGMMYILPGGDPAGPSFLVVPAGLTEALGQAPALVLLPNLRHAPLALLAAVFAAWLGFWTGRPRRESDGGCRACAAVLPAQAGTCPVCSCATDPQAALPTGEDLGWAARIPVINPFFVTDMLRWLGLSVLLVALVVGGLGLRLDPDAFRGVAALFVACGALVLAIMLLSTGIFLLIGWRSAFTVDGAGAAIRATGLTARAVQAVAAAATGGGLVRGNLAAVAAGVGAARQGDDLAWSAVRAVTGYPQQQVVALANSWRTVVRLYCPGEAAYRQVLAAARGRTLAAGGSLARAPSWLAWAGLPILLLVTAALYLRLWL